MSNRIPPLGSIPLIMEEEGFSAHVYKDTEGKDTIGFGFCVEAGISRAAAEALLKAQITEIWAMLVAERPWVTELPEQVQVVIASMAFQLGVSGTLNFKRMWTALQVRDYGQAAAECIDSKWWRQTPNRCERVAGVIRNGQCYITEE